MRWMGVTSGLSRRRKSNWAWVSIFWLERTASSSCMRCCLSFASLSFLHPHPQPSHSTHPTALSPLALDRHPAYARMRERTPLCGKRHSEGHAQSRHLLLSSRRRPRSRPLHCHREQPVPEPRADGRGRLEDWLGLARERGDHGVVRRHAAERLERAQRRHGVRAVREVDAVAVGVEALLARAPAHVRAHLHAPVRRRPRDLRVHHLARHAHPPQRLDQRRVTAADPERAVAAAAVADVEQLVVAGHAVPLPA
eukprot:49488-Rhodomonas_salina.2